MLPQYIVVIDFSTPVFVSVLACNFDFMISCSRLCNQLARSNGLSQHRALFENVFFEKQSMSIKKKRRLFLGRLYSCSINTKTLKKCYIVIQDEFIGKKQAAVYQSMKMVGS